MYFTTLMWRTSIQPWRGERRYSLRWRVAYGHY